MKKSSGRNFGCVRHSAASVTEADPVRRAFNSPRSAKFSLACCAPPPLYSSAFVSLYKVPNLQPQPLPRMVRLENVHVVFQPCIPALPITESVERCRLIESDYWAGARCITLPKGPIRDPITVTHRLEARPSINSYGLSKLHSWAPQCESEVHT